MANFEYSGITSTIVETTWESLLEQISLVIAAGLAERSAITDTDTDGDFDVTTDALYNTLLSQSRAWKKKVK